MSRRTPPEERILSKYTVEAQSGCWEWTASIDRYGRPGFFNGERQVDARRWMIEQAGREAGPGVRLYHNTERAYGHCINPEHWAQHWSTTDYKGPQFFVSLGELEQTRSRRFEDEMLEMQDWDDLFTDEAAAIREATAWFDS